VFFLIPTILFAQEVTLFQQFNGQFDYLSFGNTLNIGENGSCDEGFDTATFNLTQQNDLISTNSNDVITYYTTLEDTILIKMKFQTQVTFKILKTLN
jgi:hypothetical protein